jgi:hypothetical protein
MKHEELFESLTILERDVLLAIANSEYDDCLEEPVWTWSIEDNLRHTKKNQICGVVSSLVKKGIIGHYDAGKESTYWIFTDFTEWFTGTYCNYLFALDVEEYESGMSLAHQNKKEIEAATEDLDEGYTGGLGGMAEWNESERIRCQAEEAAEIVPSVDIPEHIQEMYDFLNKVAELPTRTLSFEASGGQLSQEARRIVKKFEQAISGARERKSADDDFDRHCNQY